MNEHILFVLVSCSYFINEMRKKEDEKYVLWTYFTEHPTTQKKDLSPDKTIEKKKLSCRFLPQIKNTFCSRVILKYFLGIGSFQIGFSFIGISTFYLNDEFWCWFFFYSFLQYIPSVCLSWQLSLLEEKKTDNTTSNIDMLSHSIPTHGNFSLICFVEQLVSYSRVFPVKKTQCLSCAFFLSSPKIIDHGE